jgi:hypothetical protein
MGVPIGAPLAASHQRSVSGVSAYGTKLAI